MDVERGGPRIFDPAKAVPGTTVKMPAPTPKSPRDRLFQNISELAFPLGKGRKRKTRKGGRKHRKTVKKTRKH
jgi:hypothetical protein